MPCFIIFIYLLFLSPQKASGIRLHGGTLPLAFFPGCFVLIPLFVLQKPLHFNYLWFQLGLSELVALKTALKTNQKSVKRDNTGFPTQQWTPDSDTQPQAQLGSFQSVLFVPAMCYFPCVLYAQPQWEGLCPDFPSSGGEDRGTQEKPIIPRL